MSVGSIFWVVLACSALGSVMFFAAGFATRFLRDPGLRRLAWVCTFAFNAVLPCVALASLGVPAPAEAPSTICAPSVSGTETGLSLAEMALGGWAGGAAAVGVWLAIAIARVQRWRCNARGFSFSGGREFDPLASIPIRICGGEGPAAPLVFGFARPVILLPREAVGWDEARLRAILLHEAGHVVNRDHLTHLLALAVCALNWFNPVFWAARGRLEAEAEMAADGYAVDHGVSASAYASALIAVAKELHSAPWKQPGAFTAMAKSFTIEERLRHVLTRTSPSKTTALARFSTVGSAVLIAGILFALTAFASSTFASAPALPPTNSANHCLPQ